MLSDSPHNRRLHWLSPVFFRQHPESACSGSWPVALLLWHADIRPRPMPYICTACLARQDKRSFQPQGRLSDCTDCCIPWLLVRLPTVAVPIPAAIFQMPVSVADTSWIRVHSQSCHGWSVGIRFSSAIRLTAWHQTENTGSIPAAGWLWWFYWFPVQHALFLSVRS